MNTYWNPVTEPILLLVPTSQDMYRIS